MEHKEIPEINFRLNENYNPRCYLKNCKYCGEKICMIRDNNGTWKPFESWAFGNCRVGEFILHECK